MITHKRLKQLLHYNPRTGAWIWKVDGHCGWRGQQVIPLKGQRAGCLNKRLNRWIIIVEGKRYYGYRLAWFYMTGKWPCCQIDHEDRNSANDRWSNLRIATPSQNLANRKAKGVYKQTYQRNGRIYFAQIGIRRKTKFLGSYYTTKEARAAYVAAARKYYGEFARAQ